uniref:Uncharacterized protein n=1 Tax=Panagrolaimus sp. JU765 TaxID=591449 RepID=A0AC34QTT0_9BILA
MSSKKINAKIPVVIISGPSDDEDETVSYYPYYFFENEPNNRNKKSDKKIPPVEQFSSLLKSKNSDYNQNTTVEDLSEEEIESKLVKQATEQSGASNDVSSAFVCKKWPLKLIHSSRPTKDEKDEDQAGKVAKDSTTNSQPLVKMSNAIDARHVPVPRELIKDPIDYAALDEYKKKNNL